MKKIEAIIKPFKLDEVRDALLEMGIAGLTVSRVEGFSSSQGPTMIYRGETYQLDSDPKTKIELLVADEDAPRAVSAVARGAKTGFGGDGKILVATVEEVVGI